MTSAATHDEDHKSEQVSTGLPCDDCGSSDAKAIYSDGHSWCFSCETYHAGESDSDGRGEGGDEDDGDVQQRASGDLVDPGTFNRLSKRKISEKTCRRFGYSVGTYRGKPVQIATYKDDAGHPVGQKLRFADKKFAVKGKISKRLFGQHLFRSNNGKQIAVTEGEIDALSIAEAWGKWPVVSVPQGSQSAKKAIAHNMEWLCSYDRVVLCFDMDEPGRKAAEECAALFPPGKAAIWHIPHKDASEMLVAGEKGALIDAIWSAKPWRPDGLVSITEAAERAMTPIERGLDWPWPRLTEATYGIRRSEVYCFGAGTGAGKTDVFIQTAAHLAGQGHPIGLFFLEQPVGETVRRLAGKMAAKRFHIPDDRNERWTDEEYADAIDKLKDMPIYLYDHFGATDWGTIKARIRFLVQCHDCYDIFIDHLTAFAAQSDDEKKTLEKVMAEISGLAQELECTIYLISHLATPEGKPHEEGGRVTIRHFKGSRAIGFWSHMMFGLERDQQEEDESKRHITTFRVLKDRYTGNATGLTFALQYNEQTGILSESEFGPDDNPFEDETTNASNSTAFT